MDEKSSPHIERVVSMQFALSLQSHLQRWLMFGERGIQGLVQHAGLDACAPQCFANRAKAAASM